MISIDHLWIPIVLSAVLIFVASSLIGNARGQVLRNRITVRIRYCKTYPLGSFNHAVPV